MAEMKPSGLPSIGDVPVDWEIKPLKYCVNINKEVILESTRPDYSFRYVDIGSVTYIDGITGYDDTTFENAPSRARRIVQKGDTIVSTVRTYLKAIARIQDDKDVIVSTGFAVLSPYSMDSIFLEYFCKSESFGEEVDRQSTGIAYPAVSASQIGRIYAPLPPLPEQQAISAFLDDRCGQVDSIIADLTQQIEILRQYKKSLITETVTKGLDRSAPMKDSGIEWIGELPAHWDVWKLGHCADVQTGPFGSQLHFEDYVDDGTPIITVEHFGDRRILHKNLPMVSDADKKRLSRYNLITGDLVFSRVGSVDRSVIVSPAENGWLFSGRCLRVRLSNAVEIDSAYMNYFFATACFKESMSLVAVGSTMPSINTEILSRVKVIRPPLAEQHDIVTFLDAKCTEIDALITEKERSIETMRQYKKSLIYEYVTGKKRVAG